MPETNLKNGDVSAYGFMCGYVQVKEVGKPVTHNARNEAFFEESKPRFQVKLFAEGCVYHVQVSDWLQYYGLREWQSYDSLKEARKGFRQAVKYYSKNDPEPLESRRFFDYSYTPEWEK